MSNHEEPPNKYLDYYHGWKFFNRPIFYWHITKYLLNKLDHNIRFGFELDTKALFDQ